MPCLQLVISQLYLEAPQWWPMAAAGAGILLLALLWLYPAQLQPVGWPWRAIIPALRGLAVLALVASILKPIAVRLATARERGQIVLLVDRSRSMSVVDNARTPAQLVALADALGRLPAGVRSGGATALAAGLEHLRSLASDVSGAREDLAYARVSGRDIEQRQARLTQAQARYTQLAQSLLASAGNLPDSAELQKELSALVHPADAAAPDAWRTMISARVIQSAAAVARYQESADTRLYQSNSTVRQACDWVAGLSRFALAGEALLRPGGLLPQFQNEAEVVAFGLAGDLTPLPLPRSPHAGATLDMIPDGDATDLTAGIAHAVAGRAARAVVLFSDGRQVGGDPTIVSGLTPNGVPVFAVSTAAPVPPRDLSFASVTAPASVFAGQSIVVRAELRHNGFDGAAVEVHCKIADNPDQVRGIVIHEGRRAIAQFTAKLAQPGARQIDLWFAQAPGEASAANNRAQRWVKVVPQRMRVLLVCGHPTWDYQYVRNSLARINPLTRQSEVELKEQALDPNHPRLRMPTRDILEQDVIVLFDVPAAALNQAQWDAVERVAQVMGGSVILVAGDAHLPSEYYNLIPTATLLPFRAPFRPAWRIWPGEEPAFHFVPAPRAEQSEVLQLGGESEGFPRESQGAAREPRGGTHEPQSGTHEPQGIPRESDNAPREPEAVLRRWEQLPPVFRFLQLPELHDERWKPQVQPLLLEEESRLPVLTEMRLGAGRAFFLGLDETWRWRLKAGDRDQDRFWRQLIEYASEDPYFAHSGPLALDADKVFAAPGEPVRIRARITDMPAVRLGGNDQLQIIRGRQVVGRQALSATDAPGSGRYAATVSLPAGDYQIRWTASGDKHQAYTVEIPLHVAQTSEAEMADLSGNEAMLRKLAEASGGEFLTLDQVSRLPERLASAGDARSRYAQLSLWDSPYLFLLVVGCLGAEWALRKRVGLA